MYEFEEQRVDLSRLKSCPVKVTLHTDKLFKNLVAVAKAHPEQIEPIAVAVLGDSQYVLNGHLRVKALESAGHDSARAYYVPVKEIVDVVRLHIELNTNGSINPFKMIDAVRFLEKHHAEQSVSKRYQDLARKKLYPKVHEQWEQFLEDASKRYTHVDLPIHVVEKIVDFNSEKEQLMATTVITDSIKNVRDSKFVFPAPHDLDVILQSISPKHNEKDVIVYEPKETEKEKWPQLDKKEAEDLVRGSSHNSIVQCRCGKKLLLNTKTHAVSSVTDDAKGGCIKLEEEEEGKTVYAIPSSMIEFLDAEGDSLRFLKIRSKKELDKFSRSIRDDKPLRLVMVLLR